LTVDNFAPRGLKNTCRGGMTADMAFDSHQALKFLAKQQFVDARLMRRLPLVQYA
jgi:hypothetical protein